jgi:hypothetical protein
MSDAHLTEPSVGAAASAAGRRCAHHAESAAAALCKRCGDFLCTACLATPPGRDALCARCNDIEGAATYYAVPVWRFMVLSLCTLGFYAYYWAFRCWRAVRQHDESKLWPFVYAVFLSITYFSLLKHLNARRLKRGLPGVSTVYPVLFLLFSAVSRVVGRFTDHSLGSVLLSDAILMLAVATLVPALHGMRELVEPAELAERDRLRLRHVLMMALGGVFIWLTTVGPLFGDPTEPPSDALRAAAEGPRRAVRAAPKSPRVALRAAASTEKLPAV